MIESLWKRPPHSPWSTAVALLGFMTLGLQPWAPYAINGVLVFAFLLIANSFLPGHNVRNQLCTLSVILVLPLTLRAVHDFRPDIALALCTAFFCLAALRYAIFPHPRKSRAVAYFLLGLLGGGTLLIKPSFIFHSLALIGLSLALSETLGFLFRTSDETNAQRVKRWLWLAFGFACSCGIYYLRSWPQIFQYVSQSTGSGKYADVWKVPGGFLGSLVKCLRTDTGWMVGPSIYLFLATIGAGCFWTFRRKDWPALAFVGGGIACAFASLCIIVYSQIDSPFFGLTWQILLTLLAVYCVGKISFESSSPLVAPLFCGAGIVALIVHPPTNIGWSEVTDAMVNKSMNRALIDRIKEEAHSPDSTLQPGKVSVDVSFIGAVNAGSQDWIAHQEGLGFIFIGLDLTADLKGLYNTARQVDVVEVADEKSRWLNRNLTSSKLQKALLQMMRADLDFAEVPPVSGTEGKVYVFVMRRGVELLDIDAPNTVESVKGDRFIWLDNRFANFIIRSNADRQARFVIPECWLGPNWPHDSKHTLLVEVNGEVTEVPISTNLNVPLTLRKGSNLIKLACKEPPTTNAFPSGDSRTLLLGIKGFEVKAADWDGQVLPDGGSASARSRLNAALPVASANRSYCAIFLDRDGVINRPVIRAG